MFMSVFHSLIVIDIEDPAWGIISRISSIYICAVMAVRKISIEAR